MDVLAALFGALIGAGGAIAAQVVSARLNGKREDRRFAYEVQRQKVEDARRASEFLFTAKRETFAAVLDFTGETRDTMRDLSTKADLDGKVIEWEDTRDWVMKWNRTLANVRLLDSHVTDAMTGLFHTFVDWNTTPAQSRNTSSMVSVWIRYESILVDSMRESLGIVE